MTWTDINPKEFSQYDGMSPADVGRSLLNKTRIHDLPLLKEQQKMLALSSSMGADPWNITIANNSWTEFWSPVYKLKDKPMVDWDEDDFFSYRAMDILIRLVDYNLRVN